MTEQDSTRHYRTLERRHMIQAKDILAAATPDAANGARGNPQLARACIDYLDFIVGRFVKQGLGNVDRLRAVVPASDQENSAVLADIEATLTTCRTQLARLVSARDADQATILFDAARQFLDFYAGTLAQRKDPAQAIVRQYFDEDTYWRETDDVTPESIETEKQLFSRLNH